MARTATIINIGERLAKSRPAPPPVEDNLSRIGVTDSAEREKFDRLNTLASLDDVATFVNEGSPADVKQTVDQRLERVELLGAAWRVAEANEWLKGADGKMMKQRELAERFDYSPGHLRLCGRLFERRPGTSENRHSRKCVEWFEANRDRMQFRPRKAEGLDYVWDCVRAADAYDNADDGQRSRSQLFEAVDEKLIRVREMAPEPATTQPQQMVRYGTVLAHALAVLRKRNIQSELSRFETMPQLIAWVSSLPWDEERDLDAWDGVKEATFGSVNIPEAFYDRDPPRPPEDGGGEEEENGAERGEDTDVHVMQPREEERRYTQAEVDRMIEERTARKAPARKRQSRS